VSIANESESDPEHRVGGGPLVPLPSLNIPGRVRAADLVRAPTWPSASEGYHRAASGGLEVGNNG
jgi:hypothetical protein